MSGSITPDTDTLSSSLLKLLRDWLQATRGNPPSFYIANAGPARDAGLRLWERTSAALASSSASPSANGGVSSGIGDTSSESDTVRAADLLAEAEGNPSLPSLKPIARQYLKDIDTTIAAPWPHGLPESTLTLSSSILEAIQLSDEAGGESGLSKSDIISLLDSTPTDKDWTAAIGYLTGEGKVRREGEKRGTRYFLNTESEGDTQ